MPFTVPCSDKDHTYYAPLTVLQSPFVEQSSEKGERGRDTLYVAQQPRKKEKEKQKIHKKGGKSMTENRNMRDKFALHFSSSKND